MRNRLATLVRSRLVVGVCGVGAGVLLIAGPSAWAQITSRATYTGCLNASTGAIYDVQKGGQPLAACSGADKKIVISGGDITSVNAGTGLTGGSTSGDATLSLDQSYLAAHTIAGVNAGTGLTGGGSTGTPTVGIAPLYQLPQGCITQGVPELATNGASWTCETNPDGYFELTIPDNHVRDVVLRDFDMEFTCESPSAVTMTVDDQSSGASAFNMVRGTLGKTTSTDIGFAMNYTQSTLVFDGDTTGGTGTFVFNGADGVVTGNLTWFPGSTSCTVDGTTDYPSMNDSP